MYSTFTNAPYSKLSAMSAKDYLITSGVSRINMDGSVMAADMNLTYDGITPHTPNWRTLLFGAFGRGAKGVYSLDVTNPIVGDESDATASSVVRWEFDGGPDANDMGYITGRTNARNNGQPAQTGFLRNGKWAAIYGNGYNSVNGTATLFIVFADGPASTGWSSTGTAPSYIKITVPARSVTDVDSAISPNGLSTPTAIDTNNDGVIDTIYAGDLKGNVWKFDVSSADPAAWGVSGSAPVFSATTTDTTPKKQPITTAVVPVQYPYGLGYILFFGTGKALELGDYPMSSVYTNSLYGIYDPYLTTLSTQTPAYPVTTGKTGLVQQLTRTQNSIRYMTSYAVDYSTNKGWYLDLPVSSEGVIFNPFAEDQFRINVRSLAPEATSDGCRYDANSYDASLNPINGNAIANVIPDAAASTVSGYTAVGRVGKNNFEFSRGGIFKVTPPTPTTTACSASQVGTSDCKCNPADSTECVYCAPGAACNPPWTIQSNQCIYRTISALGSGGVATDVRYGSCSDGRLTWREVIRNR
jgi:type IV pilus assembly protein PilY1